MTDPENILQLGIEAVKEGNKEEARNLFRLLNQQAPDHIQGWLWRAGVAESREERRAALERVLSLDPHHVIALKSLQAMQEEDERAARQAMVTPSSSPSAPASSPSPAPSPSPPAKGSHTGAEVDDPFAELDSLSDVFHEDPKAVGREPPAAKKDGPEPKAKKKEFPRSHWSRSQDDRRQKQQGDKQAMGKLSLGGIRPIVIGAVTIFLIFVLVWRLVLPRFLGGETPVAQSPIAQPPVSQNTPAAAPVAEETPLTTAEGTAGEAAASAEGGFTATPEIPIPAEAPQPVAVGGDLAGANPQPIPPNTPLESQGWLYDFQNPMFAVALGGNIGHFRPQGRYVHVLLMAANRTGVNQPLPPNFVVLKDAQGRVYLPLAAESSAYLRRGINGDVSQGEIIPANGITHSIVLIFDVAKDATNLMLFSPSRPDQGWLVLQRVQ